MNVLSLFSGIGGLDLGLERAGMTVVGQVEIDPYCQRVLAKHWPHMERHDDVRTTVQWWRSTVRPPVDVVAGGVPCQPVSVAGLGLAQDDERWLWPEFLDIVRQLRPRVVIMENVTGLLGRGLGDILGHLAAIGYDTEWDCIPAVAVGAPHIRDRWFGLAYPTSDGRQSRRPGNTEEKPQRRQPDRSSVGEDVAYANGKREQQPPGISNEWRRRPGDGGTARGWQRPTRSGHWELEPDVGRVASRFPSGLDGDINAHASCISEARTAGVPHTRRLSTLRQYLESPTPPSESAKCAICGHPLSGLPCAGACSPWYLGGWREEAEDMRCLREGVLELLARQGEDVFAYMPERIGPTQRTETMASRVDRLRGLGNAVVPQVAEHIGRLVMEAA